MKKIASLVAVATLSMGSASAFAQASNQGTEANNCDLLPTHGELTTALTTALAGGNGHTTLYFQNGSDWYSFNQGGTGNQSLGSAGLLSGSNTQGGISISPIPSPPSSALIFPSNSTEDTAISSCAISSQNSHNSGNSSYNLFSNNCTDASVDVLACANIRVYNPTLLSSSRDWIKFS